MLQPTFQSLYPFIACFWSPPLGPLVTISLYPDFHYPSHLTSIQYIKPLYLQLYSSSNLQIVSPWTSGFSCSPLYCFSSPKSSTCLHPLQLWWSTSPKDLETHIRFCSVQRPANQLWASHLPWTQDLGLGSFFGWFLLWEATQLISIALAVASQHRAVEAVDKYWAHLAALWT